MSAPTLNSPLFSQPRQHQTFEVTNEHARAFLDPIVFRANVIPGLGGVILVILRRGLALKEERIAKWYNEGGANYWCPMGRMYGTSMALRSGSSRWCSASRSHEPRKSGRDIQLFSSS